MKTLRPKTQTEDDLKILKKCLMECAEALRKGMEDALETAERNREDKKDGDTTGSSRNVRDKG